MPGAFDWAFGLDGAMICVILFVGFFTWLVFGHLRREDKREGYPKDYTASDGVRQRGGTVLNGKTVAILATHWFEQTELTEPKKALEEAGADVHIVSPVEGSAMAGVWGASSRGLKPLNALTV